ncbi:MAG TPA: hypothetical protein VEZ70_03530 [Allosphingosinicella sp.]|nr:hypothetical protein [Allosphingosinicella sp.]
MADDEPLKDEAAAREKWRGSEPPARPEGSGNSLPASEDEDERMGGGSDGSAPVGPPGTIRPPD